MDAYVFAQSATSGAVSTLAGGVGNSGPARVVCPLTGDRALYVAVAGADSSDLNDNIDAVLATTGLSGTSSFVVDPSYNAYTFPTYAEVHAYIGLAMLGTSNVATTAASAAGITGVIGVAVMTGSPNRVLVEVSASTSGAVASLLSSVTAISGVNTSFTAVGNTALGAGFESA